MIAETIFAGILVLAGILFFGFGLFAFFTDFVSYAPIDSFSPIAYAAQYMILGILLVGSGVYINNKRGYGSGSK